MLGEMGLDTLYFYLKVFKQLDETSELLLMRELGNECTFYINGREGLMCEKMDQSRFHYCLQISLLSFPHDTERVYFPFIFTYLLGKQWIYHK